MTEFIELSEGKLKYNFHHGQTKVWESQKRIVAMLAGTQGGKTSFGPLWLYDKIQKFGVGDYIIVTATYDLLELKLLPEFLNLFKTLLNLGTWHESTKVFQFDKDKTRVLIRTGIKPESIESATAKAAWLDECGQKQFKRESWEAVNRRLSLSQGPILLTTTLYTLGWLKNEIYDRWKEGNPDIDVIQFDSRLNPLFPQAEYERAKATLPRWKFNMFYRGEFDKPAGLIYDSFDESVCKIKRFEIPNTWLHYVGMDFGPNNTAVMWYAQDPMTGYFYAYREYHAGGLSSGEHAVKLKELSKGDNIIKRTGGAVAEDGWRESFTQSGWPTVKPKIKEVNVGIDRVYELHKLNKLFIFDDLQEYLNEKLSYSWELDDKYNTTGKIEDKESYHLMDCERYILSDFTPELVEKRKVKVLEFN